MHLLEMDHREAHFNAIIKNKDYLAETFEWTSHFNTLKDSVDFIKFIEECHEDCSKIVYMIWENKRIIG